MSDKDLIAEARKGAAWYGETDAGPLLERLADALEARQVDEAAACDQKAHDTLNRNLNRLSENNTGLSNALAAAVDQRDAALAAVERVRAVLSNDELVWSDGSYTNVLVVEVKDVLAALDGAPEPEWKYGMQDDYGLSFVRNIAEAYDHANRQDPELNPRPVSRRKAGPWLPVEGEKP